MLKFKNNYWINYLFNLYLIYWKAKNTRHILVTLKFRIYLKVITVYKLSN